MGRDRVNHTQDKLRGLTGLLQSDGEDGFVVDEDAFHIYLLNGRLRELWRGGWFRESTSGRSGE